MQHMTEPRSKSYRSQRLTLRFAEWGKPGAEPVLLAHGFRDHGRAWDGVAAALAHDHHLFALDLRGHGDSAWANGGTYALDDFLYDIHRFVESEGLGRFSIVAHSMGAAVCLNYAGLFPERVRHLVAIEGTWEIERPPPQFAPHETRKRLLGWLDQLDTLAAREARRFASVQEAQKRFQTRHPTIGSELARHLTAHGLRRNEDGSFCWKYDPCVRVRAPGRYTGEAILELWGRIACPVLLVHGADSTMGDAAALGLDRHFRNARAVTLDGAGHWVHHDRLDAFVGLVREALGT